MRLIILLPVYNEESSLEALLVSVHNAALEICRNPLLIICDDGSSDSSKRIIDKISIQLPIHLISHEYNRGLGETIRDLFEYSCKVSDENDIIVRMDADGTHDPKYFVSMLNKLQEGFDIVIASRFAEGGGQEGVPVDRRILSSAANSFMKLVFGIRGLKEHTSGFRMYRAKLIKRALETYGGNFIQIRGLGFTCTLEKLVKLYLLGAKIAEVPFVLRYDKKIGVSKMVSSITTLGYFVMTIMYYWPRSGWKAQYKKSNVPGSPLRIE
jgi:dolichol-phosphate mannosyltransferase